MDSNSAMNSVGGSANRDMEGNFTPKANLRKEKITSTRPVLVVQNDKNLTTINEESQYSETTFSHANSIQQDDWQTDLPKLTSLDQPSSEMKSNKNQSSISNLDEILIDEQASSTKNVQGKQPMGGFD